ncbi:phosphopentomutase [Pelagibius sp. Alg239-R121]|uniref:phosphopentomutase n=1 Tax=Pelagibius sp. Alg239-R121 TaxID=2993448 RepID=UPI0024A6D4AB|nr:phosphopentomutase [Pelagibius sp. Alg239-R121]
MTRAFILVMDSFGLGATADAPTFGDQGANTLGHIAQACDEGKADVANGRQGPLRLPNLARLGLGLAAEESAGQPPAGFAKPDHITGAYGHAAERSFGKDTPSGHWEMAGVPVEYDWGFFPKETPTFPAALTDALIARCNLSGVLGNCHASGTEIIAELGEEHIRSGKPIVYTSADSVFQVAAHETHFGLERLYELCRIAKELVDDYNIGRVIARPFVGEDAASFQRTGNRRDLTTPPPSATLLDRLKNEGAEVIAIGKIADIFAHRGMTKTVKANGNDALFEATLAETRTAPEGSLVFTNFVDFDTLFGHRRDVAGYATALEDFDRLLPNFESLLRPGDLAVITADHGCDPTWPGSDHTREHVPVLAFGPDIQPGSLGRRSTFADIGQTLARHLGIAPLDHGTDFLAA